MYDNLKERLTDMSVLATTRTPADALQYIEELEAQIEAANAVIAAERGEVLALRAKLAKIEVLALKIHTKLTGGKNE